MSRYEREIAQAVSMVRQYGQVVKWIKAQQESDPLQPWKTSDVQPTEFDVSIVFLRPGGGIGNALYRLAKGTDIPTGGPRGLMATVPFTPNLTDTVDRNGVKLKIVTIDPVAPSGEPILYVIGFA